MNQVQNAEPSRKTMTVTHEPLDRIRAAVQELHAALSDAVTTRGEAMKADLRVIPELAKAALSSLKEVLVAQDEATKKHLAEAAAHLEAVQKQLAEGLKSSGQAFETSVRKAIDDAHAAARKVSEAVAAKRNAEHTHSHA
jgi:hypothetical protein